MKLTEEQKKIVEENHNLIYWYINMKKLDVDEWYDLLAIELCYTVMKHDPSRGSLSNYFLMRADGMVSKQFRKLQAKKRIPLATEFIENVHSTNDKHDELFDEVELNHWIESQDSDILRLKVKGYNQSEIADILGVSQSYVSKVLKEKKRCYDETHR